MNYAIFGVLVLNTILLVAVARALVRLVGPKSEGYAAGAEDALRIVKKNVDRYREIVPEWLPVWVDHLIEVNRKQGLTDLPLGKK